MIELSEWVSDWYAFYCHMRDGRKKFVFARESQMIMWTYNLISTHIQFRVTRVRSSQFKIWLHESTVACKLKGECFAFYFCSIYTLYLLMLVCLWGLMLSESGIFTDVCNDLRCERARESHQFDHQLLAHMFSVLFTFFSRLLIIEFFAGLQNYKIIIKNSY